MLSSAISSPAQVDPTSASTHALVGKEGPPAAAGGLSEIILSAAGRGVFGDPPEDLLVPALAVGRLEDPVPLVGEVYEPRRHALALQRREQLLPLGHRAAEVEVVADDEHRRLVPAEVAG